MQKKSAWVIVIILVILIGAAVWYWRYSPALSGFLGANQLTLINTVDYSCAQGKSIEADLYQGPTAGTPAPGQPLTPTGSAVVKLSDGRTMTLGQTISADGVRYSNGNPQLAQGQPGAETFVFWSKGNTAQVLENNQQQTYTGCIMVANDPGDLPQTYSASDGSFSIRYPANFTVDSTYQYQEMGPGKNISGVKFTIDPTIATGTNLSSDSYISVEQIPGATSCTANKFLDLQGNGSPVSTTTDNGVEYSFASSTGAGAGNRYEEWVYAIPGSNPCMAVRYFIHYGVIQNYPPGAITQFDEAALLAQFDKIRRTLTIGQ